ncbi:PhzF family phenazine biosynthesis protein [Actinoplanes awajinensis]|uniref:Phenazine biosynthesis protein PhzF n=1 Tax=Actinoplanes awajinensis subsp. mycoplanecinus TaxID=135947 RepID=A0A101JM16_9ACTN|nr:PhzF family phenazine biosynthesis protein [Actinoplanes awajinensis]KUL29368.1 phenazine biosynthesis protein PhzF [Actinoplanes awajinensis subsp. mycoplanecinus]
MSTVAYEIVDVFTDRPFAGNPLAVVFGAEHLATDQMQTLAREFNLAETTFVLPPTEPGATYRIRIFTASAELPFAGHPSVGTAVTLMRQGRFAPGRVVQECGAGLLPLDVTAAGAATLTGAAPRLGDPIDPAGLLEIAGLPASAFAGSPSAVPREAGCGLDWTFLPVRRSALAGVHLDVPAAARLGVTGLTVFSWESGEAHARVFVPGDAVWEDPATGSAALGLGVWLVGAGWLPGDGLSSYRVHQGLEMKRPSLLSCTVSAAGGVATGATVSGHVFPVATGKIAVPPFIG